MTLESGDTSLKIMSQDKSQELRKSGPNLAKYSLGVSSKVWKWKQHFKIWLVLIEKSEDTLTQSNIIPLNSENQTTNLQKHVLRMTFWSSRMKNQTFHYKVRVWFLRTNSESCFPRQLFSQIDWFSLPKNVYLWVLDWTWGRTSCEFFLSFLKLADLGLKLTNSQPS